MAKIFTSSFLAEINTFSPMKATIDSFKSSYFVLDGDHKGEINYWISPMTIFKDNASKHGFSLVEGLSTLTTPMGKLNDEAFNYFKNIIIDKLKICMPVDMILLNLHGAMTSESFEDCEGELLKEIRKVVGKNIKIGVELDPHSHLTDAMVENSDVIIAYKEYPHTDVQERAQALFDILLATYHSKVKPIISVADAHQINLFPTEMPAMHAFLKKVRAIEKNDERVLSISIIHGFPWSDVSIIGAKIIVITNNDPAYGMRLATQLAEELYNIRHDTMPQLYTVDQALKKIAITNKIAVLADFSDNAGGGAYSDSTYVLEEFLHHQIKNAVLGCFWEPDAVVKAIEVGIGQEAIFEIGGKGPWSGPRLTVQAKVLNIVNNYKQILKNGVVSMGDTAVLDINGIVIVVNAIREQTFSTECFTNLGINLLNFLIIVVKSSIHFRASFSQLTDTILVLAIPGALNPDFIQIPYKNITRPIWPLDNLDWKNYNVKEVTSL